MDFFFSEIAFRIIQLGFSHYVSETLTPRNLKFPSYPHDIVTDQLVFKEEGMCSGVDLYFIRWNRPFSCPIHSGLFSICILITPKCLSIQGYHPTWTG